MAAHPIEDIGAKLRAMSRGSSSARWSTGAELIRSCTRTVPMNWAV